MSDYRFLAKAVAILDLVLSTISMLLVIGIVIFKSVTVTWLDRIEQNLPPDVAPFAAAIGLKNPFNWAWILYVFVGICAILIALRTWAAVQLLLATTIGREPVNANRKASFWWYVSVVFLGLDILGLHATGLVVFLGLEVTGFRALSLLVLGVSGMIVALPIQLLVHGGMIYIVFRYMQELQRSISSVPVSVTVPKFSTLSSSIS